MGCVAQTVAVAESVHRADKHCECGIAWKGSLGSTTLKREKKTEFCLKL